MMLLGWFLAHALMAGPDSSGLGLMAELARAAFVTRDFRQLLADRQSVRLELPDGNASASVTGRVAAASLGALFRRTEDRRLEVLGAALADPDHGYIELRRRYAVARTQEERIQRVLISARRESGEWRVVEIWVSAAR